MVDSIVCSLMLILFKGDNMKIKDIKTIDDLDNYRFDNPQIDCIGKPCISSRFGILEIMYGTDKAHAILHELAIQSCCKKV